MPRRTYSQNVLEGLRAEGYSVPSMIAMLGQHSDEFELILSGLTHLSDDMLAAIERTTGQSCGQLAAKSMEPKGGPLTSLMEEWARVMHVSRSDDLETGTSASGSIPTGTSRAMAKSSVDRRKGHVPRPKAKPAARRRPEAPRV